MVEKEEKGLYARAHKKISDLIPDLKGEALSREQWYKLCNIHPTSIKHRDHREAINEVLNKMAKNKNKIIVKHGSLYKVVDDTLVPINFKNPVGHKVDLVFPFGIHQYGYLYQGNIAVVFGSKDAGKTAFALNVIRMNMSKHVIKYWSSEMVEDELAARLSKYEYLLPEEWKFEAYERSYDFDQVIDPDAINIIDYLELGGDEMEYYRGVGLIRKIFDKLDTGVAIIACQKNENAELPKGGSGILEKSRIAVSLDPGKAVLKVCKNWAEGVVTSPRGKSWSYQLVGGINYVNVQEC